MHRDEITRSRGAGSRLTVPANPACEADFCGHAAGLKPRRAEEARLAGSALVAAGATRSFAKILLPPDPFLRHIKLRTICIMVLCDINMYFELSIFFALLEISNTHLPNSESATVWRPVLVSHRMFVQCGRCQAATE